MRRAVLLAAWVGSALLSGCRSQAAVTAATYYPLRPGASLGYRIVVDATDEVDQEDGPLEMQVVTIGPEDVAGVHVTRQQVDRGDDTYFLFMGADEHGVFRHATQAPGEDTPAVAAERSFFLRDPLRVGSSWPGESSPSYIDIVGFFGPVDVVSTVEAVGELVQTPAGEFRDTVRIEVKGSARVGDDQQGSGAGTVPNDEDWDLGQGSFTIAETIWLARDVGTVKAVRVEGFAGDFDERTVTVTTELQSYAR